MLYKCLNIKNGITRIWAQMKLRDFNGTAVNFYIKSANKSTEILQIKIYLLLLQRNYQIKYLYVKGKARDRLCIYTDQPEF